MSEQPPDRRPDAKKAPDAPTAKQPPVGQPAYGAQPTAPLAPTPPPPVGPPPAGPPAYGPQLGTPDAPPPSDRSFARRHRTPLVVAAAVIVLGAAGAGIAVAATSDSTSTPHAATSSVPGEGTPASGNAAAAGNGKKGKNGKKNNQARRATRATITAESGSTWTVRTAQGQSVAVTITGQTKFGSMKAPATRTQFTVGKQVAVIGPHTGSGITAKRIRFPVQKGAGQAAPAASPSSSPS